MIWNKSDEKKPDVFIHANSELYTFVLVLEHYYLTLSNSTKDC